MVIKDFLSRSRLHGQLRLICEIEHLALAALEIEHGIKMSRVYTADLMPLSVTRLKQGDFCWISRLLLILGCGGRRFLAK